MVNEVIRFVKENGGLEYASEKMHEFKQKAIETLDSFPDTPARKSLKDLVEYTVARRKDYLFTYIVISATVFLLCFSLE